MQQEIYVFRLADKIAEPQFFTLSFAPSTNRRYYIIRMLSISNQFMITKIDTSVMISHNRQPLIMVIIMNRKRK